MTTTTGRRYRTEVYNEIDAAAEARGRTVGRAEGVARAVLTLLDKRGVAVPAEIRERILACTDSEQADLWFDRALTAATVEDVVRAD